MTRTRPSGNMLGPIDESADYSRSGTPAGARADQAAGTPAATRVNTGAPAPGDAPRVALVPAQLAGERLDKVLAKVFPE
jgi:23S rRNA pseudouridine1911/1915/1917 synthase